MKVLPPHRACRFVGQRVIVSLYAWNRAYAGTIERLDERGVQVRFDEPVNGQMTCYATHQEVQR